MSPRHRATQSGNSFPSRPDRLERPQACRSVLDPADRMRGPSAKLRQASQPVDAEFAALVHQKIPRRFFSILVRFDGIAQKNCAWLCLRRAPP